ncbi:MAG: Uma2 family endonuclease [Chloroflexota bacterium]|nr:Uma2 family endonuclease [Chloroflexota bacterium]
MVMEQQLQKISADRFIALVDSPEYADRIVELVEGEIIEMPKPTGLHGQITMRLGAKIFNHAEDNGLGIVTAADTGFILESDLDGGDTVRGLDIAFIRKGRAPGVLPDQLVDVAPDLAVEVISPSNKATDIHRKIRQLLAAGTTLIWIVYPEMRIVDVHTLDGATTLNAADTLSGGDVLPGFEIPVREIFPAPASS